MVRWQVNDNCAGCTLIDKQEPDKHSSKMFKLPKPLSLVHQRLLFFHSHPAHALVRLSTAPVVFDSLQAETESLAELVRQAHIRRAHSHVQEATAADLDVDKCNVLGVRQSTCRDSLVRCCGENGVVSKVASHINQLASRRTRLDGLHRVNGELVHAAHKVLERPHRAGVDLALLLAWARAPAHTKVLGRDLPRLKRSAIVLEWGVSMAHHTAGALAHICKESN